MLAVAGGGYLASTAAVGGANFWNPVGWVVLGGITIIVLSYVAVTLYNYASSTKATKTKTLADVKLRQQSGKHYQLFPKPPRPQQNPISVRFCIDRQI